MSKKEEIRDWVIYKITSPSGRVYIGKTGDYKQRVKQYKCDAKKGYGNGAITKSLLKYGFNAHCFGVIDSFIGDAIYCSGREMFWIRSYMSNVNKWPKMNGLNLTDGGEGMVGYAMKEETKEKLREINRLNPSMGMKGKKHTEESKLKQSLKKIGKPPPNKGKKMPAHQIEILRKINTGRPAWNKGKSYSNLSQEERSDKFGKHNVGNSYNKGRKQSPDVVSARADRLRGRQLEKNWSPITQYGVNGEPIASFKSVKEAAATIKIHRTTVSKLLRTGKPTKFTKFYFKYDTNK